MSRQIDASNFTKEQDMKIKLLWSQSEDGPIALFESLSREPAGLVYQVSNDSFAILTWCHYVTGLLLNKEWEESDIYSDTRRRPYTLYKCIVNVPELKIFLARRVDQVRYAYRVEWVTVVDSNFKSSKLMLKDVVGFKMLGMSADKFWGSTRKRDRSVTYLV